MKEYGADMKPHVEMYQDPESVYAERYNQQPLRYVERQKEIREKEAGKLRKEAYKGRYS